MEGAHIVIGAQWGDEGKGKIVDVLASEADAVIRFNGGANAGHTLEIGGTKTVLHLLPVGIVRRGTTNIVGPYVVCDPEVLVTELEIAKASGANVVLDRRAPLVLPIHKQIDAGREQASGAGKIGTTGRGIGPCYEDFTSRRGPTLGDLTDCERFITALAQRGYYAERMAVAAHYGLTPMTVNETVDWAMRFSARIVPHLGDAVQEAAELQQQRLNLLFEGAQGIMLDLVHGGRPYCTSSFCGSGAVAATMGVHSFDRVVGVAKAYVTRVGGGPFPTELTDKTGDLLREKGREFGATTGRPRRCGWLDLAALRYACRVGGVTELVLTKLDILSGLSEIKVCTGYQLDGNTIDPLTTLTADLLSCAAPIYEILPVWNEDLRKYEGFWQLPPPVLRYIRYIEKTLDIPVAGVGVGPEREQMIWK